MRDVRLSAHVLAQMQTYPQVTLGLQGLSEQPGTVTPTCVITLS